MRAEGVPPRRAIRLRGAAYRRMPADTAAHGPFGHSDVRISPQMHVICIIFRIPERPKRNTKNAISTPRSALSAISDASFFIFIGLKRFAKRIRSRAISSFLFAPSYIYYACIYYIIIYCIKPRTRRQRKRSLPSKNAQAARIGPAESAAAKAYCAQPSAQ